MGNRDEFFRHPGPGDNKCLKIKKIRRGFFAKGIFELWDVPILADFDPHQYLGNGLRYRRTVKTVELSSAQRTNCLPESKLWGHCKGEFLGVENFPKILERHNSGS